MVAWLYTLELEDNNFYVGSTSKLPDYRLAEHLSGKGAAWTRQHLPIKCKDVKKFVDLTQARLEEDKKVLELMLKYGIDKVRGGTYSQVDLGEDIIQDVSRKLRHASDLCFICGRKDHYASSCDAKQRSYTNQHSEQRAGKRAKRSSGHESSSCYARTSVGGEGLVERNSYGEIGFGGCRRCGRNGHNANSCYAKTTIHGERIEDESDEESEDEESCSRASSVNCYRCGRSGHESSSCYAKTTIHGERIEDKSDKESVENESNYLVGSGSCCRCGRSGHESSSCYAKTTIHGERIEDESDEESEEEDSNYLVGSGSCYRCGRSGHNASSCYARTTIHGERIED